MRSARSMMAVRWFALSGVVVLAACSGSGGVEPAAVEPTSVTSTVVTSPVPDPTRVDGPLPSGCGATPLIVSGTSVEVRGVSADLSVYGLLFGGSAKPFRPGDELKIVWRITGQGDLTVSFAGPDGQLRALEFGPEPHGSSTYNRPGDEWGTGFRFDRPGCWHIHLQRTTGSGDVWLNVEA